MTIKIETAMELKDHDMKLLLADAEAQNISVDFLLVIIIRNYITAIDKNGPGKVLS